MQLKLSVQFTICLVVAHIVAAQIILVTDLPEWARWPIVVLVLFNLAYYLLRDVLLLLPNSWQKIVLHADGLSVQLRHGEWQQVKVSYKTFVSPFFVVLYVKPEQSWWPDARVIFPDALPADLFRKFCVLLRFAY